MCGAGPTRAMVHAGAGAGADKTGNRRHGGQTMTASFVPHPATTLRRAVTEAADISQAVAELHAGLSQDNASLVLLFVSPRLALDPLASELARRFAGTPVVGCTTAGEITPRGYARGSITGVSFAAPDFHTVARRIPDVRQFSVADGRSLVRDCLRELNRGTPGWPASQVFAMLFIDGLAACEESVVSAIHRELDVIPLVGGSAGDELDFRATKILADGAFHRHSAVLVLVATALPFCRFKTDHFTSSHSKMVVTGADPAQRIVTEINAEPAAEEYARLIGRAVDDLTPEIFATYPVVVRVGDTPYARSIQKANADGSLTFYCAIDQGIVLTVARDLDIVADLRRLFGDIRQEIGPPELVVGYDCILRGLEVRQKGLEQEVSRLMIANNVVGFSTYGEQYDAMHFNQTFTGIAIGRRA